MIGDYLDNASKNGVEDTYDYKVLNLVDYLLVHNGRGTMNEGSVNQQLAEIFIISAGLHRIDLSTINTKLCITYATFHSTATQLHHNIVKYLIKIFDKIPVKYKKINAETLYTEKWVVDAIKIWTQYNGYGGLKLYKFLNKMKDA